MNLEFDGKTMKQRIMNRARYVGLAVFLALMLILFVTLFFASNSIIDLNITLSFVLQAIGLSVLAGAIIAFIYYVISGWMFLGD